MLTIRGLLGTDTFYEKWMIDSGFLPDGLRMPFEDWFKGYDCERDGDIYVALDVEYPVGTFRLRKGNPRTKVELCWFYVAVPGLGYGTQIANFVRESVPTANELWLRVDDFNGKAIRVYEKAGFVFDHAVLIYKRGKA